MSPPAAFGPEFLEWLRVRTEAAWAARPAGQAGAGLRWERALSAADLRRAEARFGAPFPDDYRLFLTTLHTTSHGAERGWAFYDWTASDGAVERATEWLVDGIVFDIEANGLWRPSWGARPDEAEARRNVVAQAIGRAPRLVPVIGHRFLLAEPRRSGNPVFSIHQSDAIVYGADLRRYLLNELGGSVNVASDHTIAVDTASIPFWSELLT